MNISHKIRDNFFRRSIFTLLFILFTTLYLPVCGEGSALYNNGSSTGRTFLNGWGKREEGARDTIFRVYVKPGEKVLLGSSSFMKSEDIRVWLPDGTQVNYDITAVGAKLNSSNNCNYQGGGGKPYTFTNAPTKRSKGFILNFAEEQAGPKPLNPNGYDPIEINIEQEGYLDVHFRPSNSTGMSAHVRYDSVFQHNPVLNGNEFCSTSTDGVGAWDITVVGTDGAKKDGRVFTDHLVFRHNANLNSSFTGYVLTDDGFIYKVETGKINGIDWLFFANNRGIIHTASDKTFYGSLYGCLLNSNSDNAVQDSDGYNNGCGFRTYSPVNLNFNKNANGDVAYRIFLNYPDPDLLTYINLISPVAEIPEISNLSFAKSQSDGSGVFSFDTTEEDNAYSLDIELFDKNQSVGKINFTGFTQEENTIPWNGKDSDDETVSYDRLKATLTVKRGEMHILFDDVEYIYDGIKSYCMNCTVGTPSLIHYNNSNMTFEGVNNKMNLYIQNNPVDMVMYNGNLVDASDNSKIYFYGELDQSNGIDSYAFPALKADYRYSDLVSLNTWSESVTNQTEKIFDFSTVNITVRKIWQDNNDRDHYRPDSVQINLLCNDTLCGSSPYTITKEHGWTVTIPDLPIYDSEGQLYDYSVAEINP